MARDGVMALPLSSFFVDIWFFLTGLGRNGSIEAFMISFVLICGVHGDSKGERWE
jgi:hypothetical protein